MRRARPDQAEGLRRLLGRRANAQVSALAAAQRGVGKRTLALNLAAALATAGQKVLLLQGDAPAGKDFLRARVELLGQAANPQCARKLCAQLDASAATLARTASANVTVLFIPELFVGLRLWNGKQRESVAAALGHLTRVVDSLLIDVPLDITCAQACQLGAEAITLVVTPSPRTITAAYRIIKQAAHAHGPRRFQVIVNKARDVHEARHVFDNLAYATRRYLSEGIDFLGYVANDVALRRCGTRGDALIERSASAPVARQLRQLAATLVAGPADVLQTNALRTALRGHTPNYFRMRDI